MTSSSRNLLKEMTVKNIFPPSVIGQAHSLAAAQYQAKEMLQLIEQGGNIDFPRIAELALSEADRILPHFLPDGKYEGNEYVALNPIREDSELGSFKINATKGVWADFADDAGGGDFVSLFAYLEETSQAKAALFLLKFLSQEEHAPQRQHNAKRWVTQPTAEEKLDTAVVMPIPLGAMERPASFHALGVPSKSWRYTNANGQTMCYVDRFDKTGGKTIRPLTYWVDKNGVGAWLQKAPPAPRPAYGLDKLSAYPNAPVVFAEGEKAADAAQRLLPDFVSVTTLGGAMACDKTDLNPFVGREVYVAPDNDEAGMEYARKLLLALKAVGANVKGMLNNQCFVTGEAMLPLGFDLADAEETGWTAQKVKDLGQRLWLPVQGEAPAETPAAPRKKETVQELATRFTATCFPDGLAFTQNQFRAYRNGHWPVLDRKVDLERQLCTLLGTYANPASIGSCISLMSSAHAEMDELFSTPKNFVCLLNGTLEPVEGKLYPHNKEHKLTNQVKINWDGDAQCPLWVQTLSEIFAPDDDGEEKIALLQEFMDYCLVPMTHMHKFLWMVGGGGNGKSLVLNVLTELVGRENISFAQIERIQEKFVRAELCGKLLNISSEMSSQATIADGYLKQIVGGEVIEAERKNQPSFSFKPYCRMIGATNELPRLLDTTNGFFRRAIIVQFNRQFAESEQDRTREPRLMEELPGILRWAVAGLQRLLSNGAFTIPQSSRAELLKYQLSSDPIRQFTEECLARSEDKGEFQTPLRLYENYQAWCRGYGYQPVAINKLSSRLMLLGFERIRPGGVRQWKVQYTPPALDAPLQASVQVSLSPLAARYAV